MFSATLRLQLRTRATVLRNTNRGLFTSAIIKNDEKHHKDQEKHDKNREKLNKEKKHDTNEEKHESQTNDSTQNTNPDQVELSIEDELKAVSTKLKEVQAAYLLSLADQENLRQRSLRDIANAKDFAIQNFAKDLLSSLDILGMALNSVPTDFREKQACLKKNKDDIVEQLVTLYTGVDMTEKELIKTLKRHDVQEDDPLDQVFDPNKHEAVFQAPMTDKKPGTIFVVQKKGFLLKNRILRPAQVGVVADK